MPQITLDYTNNLNPDINFEILFSEIHQKLNEVAGIKIGNCKSRAIKLDNYFIAAGEDKNAFVHIDVRMLSGRTIEIKKKLGEEILLIIKRYFSKFVEKFDLQITVEIQDIERAFYFKYPDGTLKYN